MRDFWAFAKRMRRRPGQLALALFFACVSSVSVGAGILGIKPVLDSIIGNSAGPGAGVRKGLPELAVDLNNKLAASSWSMGLRVPDSVIHWLPQGEMTAVSSVVGFLGVLTVIGAACNFMHMYLSQTIVNRTVTQIRREVHRKTLKRPLRDIVTIGPSDIVSRLVADTLQLQAGFNAILSKGVSEVAKGSGALVAAFIVNWRLTSITLLVAPILGYMIKTLSKTVRRRSKKALASQSELTRATMESLQGLRVVKLHTTERYEGGRFHRLNKSMMRELNAARMARALSSPLTEVVSILVIGALALVAVKAILDRNLDASSFFLTLAGLGLAAAGLKPLTGIINDVQTSAAAAERIAEALNAPEEPGHGRDLPKMPAHSESIAFESVELTYPNADKPALNGVSLRVRAGEKIAVVGPNGSGKTTLLALVPRLFDPQSGAILIDGKDIRTFNVRSVRRQIGVVTQETVLFKDTIHNNIAYGSEGATRETVIAAAKRARADEFISALPQGYDTTVAEQGMSLSGGQRQRIAIARAILRDPSILILDEATSMIDSDSEAKIAEAIDEFTRGRTCLVVAHRLSTVLSADRIVVMNAGRIEDVGTHAQLLERCETYRTLARHQLVAVE